jgi:hypothetical protein
MFGTLKNATEYIYISLLFYVPNSLEGLTAIVNAIHHQDKHRILLCRETQSKTKFIRLSQCEKNVSSLFPIRLNFSIQNVCIVWIGKLWISQFHQKFTHYTIKNIMILYFFQTTLLSYWLNCMLPARLCSTFVLYFPHNLLYIDFIFRILEYAIILLKFWNWYFHLVDGLLQDWEVYQLACL